MAKKTVVVSDLSGKELDEKNSVKITVSFSDARRGIYTVDADPGDTIVKQLIEAGTPQKRRGRRPKTA